MTLLVSQVQGYEENAIERLRLEHQYAASIKEELRLARFVSYVGNKQAPLLRLYRFKEAFSFDFARTFIRRFRLSEDDYILDSFMGMGSTLFAAMLEGVDSIGLDKLPVAAFIAKTIPKFLDVERGSLFETYKKVRSRVSDAELAPVALDVPLMKTAFNQATLTRLRKWKTVIDKDLSSPYDDIFRLLFFSILEATSYTAKDGQFLRLKPRKQLADPDSALLEKVREAEEDLARIQWFFTRMNSHREHLPQALEDDALDLNNVPFKKQPTCLICSPPYLNRYDYSRSYCLELCFHFVKNFEELKKVRFSILRSHIESRTEQGERATHPAIIEVLESLNRKDLNNPRIPYMITGYFNDMEKVISQWSHVLAHDAPVAMVIDNVRFEGELIPVDLVLSDIAEKNGFDVERIIVTRYKGNSSQQMAKYGRVPVRESVVVWRRK